MVEKHRYIKTRLNALICHLKFSSHQQNLLSSISFKQRLNHLLHNKSFLFTQTSLTFTMKSTMIIAALAYAMFGMSIASPVGDLGLDTRQNEPTGDGDVSHRN